ncbi:MAG: RsmB/NOP family class I SAM-dependent RNA methyltransferase [Hyphomonas sp.]|uniref:RsmB/NOP family class I SAM-dependent RNA methyltransferase n=1 Tax=Hyphomonas sp. TaxID=87 RepID=UPI0030017B5B
MSGADIRRAAADLLTLTLDSRRTLDDAMLTSQVFNTLEGSDRGFARAIASTALRHLGWIDTALAPLLSRPLPAVTAPIRALLRTGVTQLWLMDTPPHAAVGETVEAAKGWPEARSGGAFLNAVLRRADRERPDFARMSPLGIWPDWLQDLLVSAYGTDEAEELAKAQLTEPTLYLTPKADADAVAAETDGIVMAGGGVAVSTGSVEDMDGFASGDWWVQDLAAMIPSHLLDPQPDEMIVDLCAAPGGKTLQLAAAGAHVTAVDRSVPRLRFLKENLARTGLSATVIAANADEWRPDAPVMKVLLDAPCSALGTLRRHPEGAWIKREAEVARFPAAQARLLDAAIDMLGPGGTLIYCVCTPLPAEGIDIVEAALADGRVHREAITAADVPGFSHAITASGDVLTRPGGESDHDIFFISRLKKA